MIIWKLIKIAWRLIKIAWLLVRIARRLTRPPRVRRSRWFCKWRPGDISGGRQEEPVIQWSSGLIPSEITPEITPERMEAMRRALAEVQANRHAGSGLERGPIILHMRDEVPEVLGTTGSGKSSLVGQMVADLIHRGRSDTISGLPWGDHPNLKGVAAEFFERAEHLTAGQRTNSYPVKCLCVRYLPTKCPAMAEPGLLTCADCRGDCVVVTDGPSARHASAPDYEFARPRSCPSCQSIGAPRAGCADPWHR